VTERREIRKVKIPFNVLDRLFLQHQDEYEAAALRVLRSGWYTLGCELEKFEQRFSNLYDGFRCVGLNSGLDALILAFRALGIGAGDEVIVPANTYIASVIAITENNATPIFVEPDEFYNLDVSKIESAITSSTKAILPVHLYGQPCNIQTICDIAKRYGLYVVEDCAQSHTARFNGKLTGTFGDIGCFSFYPTKNLGAFGDSGAVITANNKLAEKIHMMRNYGSRVKYINEISGVNSRLDEIQAALLQVRINIIDKIINERKYIAQRYLDSIKNSAIVLPKLAQGVEHVWHLFVVRTDKRDEFQQYLQKHGISTQIHYPIPPHLAECYRALGYGKGSFPITETYAETMLSLPLFNGMTQEEVEYVVAIINEWR
jgi:dTDP-4-amino-4,6-dideoxygalactose transaminase